MDSEASDARGAYDNFFSTVVSQMEYRVLMDFAKACRMRAYALKLENGNVPLAPCVELTEFSNDLVVAAHAKQ